MLKQPNIYFVVVVNGNFLDSHAHPTFQGALDLVSPDGGTPVQAYLVAAQDAGGARLIPARLSQAERESAAWAANHMKGFAT